jgi:hypothetical protein
MQYFIPCSIYIQLLNCRTTLITPSQTSNQIQGHPPPHFNQKGTPTKNFKFEKKEVKNLTFLFQFLTENKRTTKSLSIFFQQPKSQIYTYGSKN